MKFISEISPLYIVLFIAFAIALSIFLYRGKEGEGFPKKIRWILIALRTLGLVLVGVLFLGIFMQTTKNKLEKPILINLIDNSQSMGNYADSSKVKKQINDYLNQLDDANRDQYIIKNYLVGENLRELDTINFKDSKTNLSQPFEQLYEQFYNSNIGAVTLISDGNFNEGNHPIYEINNLNHTPVFTLGVGDTVTKKDVLIKNIQTNDFVYLDNSFPIEALIEAKKIGNKTLKVRLFNQKKEIASKEISVRAGEEYYRVNFEVQAKKGGVQRYELIVDPVQGEFTTKNNARSFYIEVINDTKKILILSNAPHPDISALKSVLEKDKINQVDVKLLSKWDQNSSKYDLVIFHNPLVGSNGVVANKIAQQKTPILAILGEQSNFRQTFPFMGMRYTSGNQKDENTPIYNQKFDLFEISNELKSQLSNFPPLVSTFGKMQLQPNTKTLFYQGVGGVAKESAQIFFHETNQVKIGVILGEGVWRWRMNDFRTKGNSDTFDELFGKITRYLTTKKNNSPFRVTVPRRTKTDEPLILKAEVFNASMERVTHENVSFTLTNEKNKKQVYDFSVVQNYYSLNLGKLPAGDYKWEATTIIDSKKVSQYGELVIEAGNAEMTNNISDFRTLEAISQQSKAKFYPLSKFQKLIDEIQLRDDIRPIESQENDVKNLIDYWWLILLICGVFGVEWFIKKYNGSY